MIWRRRHTYTKTRCPEVDVSTHQENSEVCEVIAETAGPIGGNALGHTAAAAPTPLAI